MSIGPLGRLCCELFPSMALGDWESLYALFCVARHRSGQRVCGMRCAWPEGAECGAHGKSMWNAVRTAKAIVFTPRTRQELAPAPVVSSYRKLALASEIGSGSPRELAPAPMLSVVLWLKLLVVLWFTLLEMRFMLWFMLSEMPPCQSCWLLRTILGAVVHAVVLD